MERCPRCTSFVDTARAYCQVCSRPRILESLRAPWARPAWQDQAWRGATVTLVLWLVITAGVAFLREAKAVRDSRQLLAEDKAQEAWSRLEPFLQEHPRHRQALLLCGKATVRLDRRTEAKDCLDRLASRSPELAQELRQDYTQTLPGVTRKLSCDAAAFQELLAWAGTLGEGFDGAVIAGLDGLVETCRAARRSDQLAAIAGSLAEQGRGTALVEQGFVPVLRQALVQGEYHQARSLVRQAGSLVPDGVSKIDEALADERRKISATMTTLRDLVSALQADATFRNGSAGCFPAAAPPAVRSARDAWGSPVVYSADNGYAGPNGRQCYQTFGVTSSGGDGDKILDEWQGTPTILFCRASPGWEDCTFPERFWQTSG